MLFGSRRETQFTPHEWNLMDRAHETASNILGVIDGCTLMQAGLPESS